MKNLLTRSLMLFVSGVFFATSSYAGEIVNLKCEGVWSSGDSWTRYWILDIDNKTVSDESQKKYDVLRFTSTEIEISGGRNYYGEKLTWTINRLDGYIESTRNGTVGRKGTCEKVRSKF